MKQDKLTILPLHSIESNVLGENEVFDLGFGISVEKCKGLLKRTDKSLWNWEASKRDDKELEKWDICLVRRYQSDPGTGHPEQESINLLAYVLAHLRLINPHRDSVDDAIQLDKQTAGPTEYSIFQRHKASFRPNRFLCDCENLCWGIKRDHLIELKGFMPWIVEFFEHWSAYYPLWISLRFIEQTYLPNQDFRMVHLFTVMALEGLFCSEMSFGKKALTHRIPKLLGTGIDLYEPYHVDFFSLPRMELTADLIKDVYTLRNKIAHSDKLPEEWTKTKARAGLNESIPYFGQLHEAATSMVRLSWLTIIRKNLQKTFSDKQKMQDFLR